jgi:hypothetical protein
MSRARGMVVTLILLGLLATFGGATFGVPDSLAPPGYFDGGDGDDALWLASEGLPAIVLPVFALVLIAAARAALPSYGRGARPLAAPLAARLRAPPLS